MAAKVLKGEAKASEQNLETITEPGFYVNNKVAAVSYTHLFITVRFVSH